MINVITRPGDNKVISDVELLFPNYIFSSDFTDLAIRALESIDSAKLLDKNTEAIQTPFGVTDIYHLSTGCKLVIFYLYMQTDIGRSSFGDCILDITECGINALVELFNCVESLNDTTTVFLLRHMDHTHLLEGFRGTVNGQPCDSLDWGLWRYG